MTDATTSEMRRTQVSVFAYFVHTESDGEERRDGDKVTGKQASKQAGKTSKVEPCSSCALANRRQTPKVCWCLMMMMMKMLIILTGNHGLHGSLQCSPAEFRPAQTRHHRTRKISCKRFPVLE
ncbi:uncharacterized protein CCOS01_04595 [Colletotrichum costaricense]|uniref:Uncharacterized protein n=1 Tax=Colletotrichum costaricense TaxID=1209916 RepID=A0AAI9Z2Y4_9PEZI|nr:uncharacterized protein CCOS01_04595 [Colletotrichum costaricense]KAK1532612.1 hypothetical protein CCOS01_04595 [Colletotrichum costaricense]